MGFGIFKAYLKTNFKRKTHCKRIVILKQLNSLEKSV